jgi:hypothetical protein
MKRRRYEQRLTENRGNPLYSNPATPHISKTPKKRVIPRSRFQSKSREINPHEMSRNNNFSSLSKKRQLDLVQRMRSESVQRKRENSYENRQRLMMVNDNTKKHQYG